MSKGLTRSSIYLNRRRTQERPSPLRQWCISPCFRFFPLFPKQFSDSVENFPDFIFSQKMFRFFNPPKFWISPYFRCVSTYPPYFEKIIVSFYTYANFPPDFVKFTCFQYFRPYVFFVSLLWPWYIYASHNARTGLPWTYMNIGHAVSHEVSCMLQRNLQPCTLLIRVIIISEAIVIVTIAVLLQVGLRA